jgi:hypothetical protein
MEITMNTTSTVILYLIARILILLVRVQLDDMGKISASRELDRLDSMLDSVKRGDDS